MAAGADDHEQAGARARPELHRTPERSSTAPPSTAPIDPPPLRHCWVTKQYGRVPGLLLEWRRSGAERVWEGRVVHPVLLDDGWELYEEWLAARCIEQG